MKPTGQQTVWQAMSFVWDVVFSIAVPTTAFALLGRWLDQRWNISPWMTLLGLVLALGLAYLLVMRKIKQYRSSFLKSS